MEARRVEEDVDQDRFPADAIVVVDGVPYVSQLPNDGSTKLKWVPLESGSAVEIQEQLAVKTKLRMMGAMLLDDTRNSAYDRALGECVRPGDVVLDAGAGTGLLSMMAARHGAKRVYACEMNDYFAEISQRIVLDNGLDEQVKVVKKRTTDISIDADMDSEPADVIVSETMDSILTTEGMIQTLRDAKRRLGKASTRVIPQRGAIFGRLVSFEEGSIFREVHRLGLGRSHNDRKPLLLHADSPVFRKTASTISGDVELLSLDFISDEDNEGIIERLVVFEVSQGQQPHAMLMWWTVNLFGEISISTHPETASWQDHWHHALYLLEPGEEEQTSLVSIRVCLNTVEGDIQVSREEIAVKEKDQKKKMPRIDEQQPSPDMIDSLPALYNFHHWTSRYLRSAFDQVRSSTRTTTLLDLSALPSPAMKQALGFTSATFRISTAESIAVFCPAQSAPSMMLVENEVDAAMFYLYRCVNCLPAGSSQALPASCLVKVVSILFANLQSPVLHLGTVAGFNHRELFRYWNSAEPWSFPLCMASYQFKCTSDAIVVATMGFVTGDLQFSQSNARVRTQEANAIALWVEWTFPDGKTMDSSSPLSTKLDPMSFCQVNFLSEEINQPMEVEISAALDDLTNRLRFTASIAQCPPDDESLQGK